MEDDLSWQKLSRAIGRDLDRVLAGDDAITASSVMAVVKFIASSTELAGQPEAFTGTQSDPLRSMFDHLPTFEDEAEEDSNVNGSIPITLNSNQTPPGLRITALDPVQAPAGQAHRPTITHAS